MWKPCLGALTAALLSAAPASAHVTLERAEAPAGTTYKAVFRVPHGCEGAATTALSVEIPDGVSEVKPMPHAGWTLTINRREDAKRSVTSVTWAGGNLPDEQYDEFALRGALGEALKPGDIVRFPVVQTCEKGENRWVDIPAHGQNPYALPHPAPFVKIAGPAQPVPAASEVRIGALQVKAPWTRATPNGAKIGAGYVTITNTGTEADRLIGGNLAIAGAVQVHEMTMQDNVMRMRPLPAGLEIKPGETVELKPGGYHLMLMNLTAPLAEGQKITGALVFEKAGKVEITFDVRGIGAQTSGAGEHQHH